MQAKVLQFKPAYVIYGSLALEDCERDAGQGCVMPLRQVNTPVAAAARTERKEAPRTRTRRFSAAQVVAISLVTVLLLVALDLGIGVRRATQLEEAFDAASTTQVYVQPGGSVWSYASRCQVEGASTNDVVRWILETNHMDDSSIAPGDVLLVPNYCAG